MQCAGEWGSLWVGNGCTDPGWGEAGTAKGKMWILRVMPGGGVGPYLGLSWARLLRAVLVSPAVPNVLQTFPTFRKIFRTCVPSDVSNDCTLGSWI